MCETVTQLGIDLDLQDGDLVSDALIIMKIHKPDGGVTVATRVTDGTDWVTVRGMVAAAEDVESTGYAPTTGDDDP